MKHWILVPIPECWPLIEISQLYWVTKYQFASLNLDSISQKNPQKNPKKAPFPTGNFYFPPDLIPAPAFIHKLYVMATVMEIQGRNITPRVPGD